MRRIHPGKKEKKKKEKKKIKRKKEEEKSSVSILTIVVLLEMTRLVLFELFVTNLLLFEPQGKTAR